MRYIGNFFRKNTVLKIGSLIVAILLWIFVATSIMPEMDIVISDIPITIDLKGTAAESAGLEVVDGHNRTVSVAVKGKRYIVGNLDRDDIIVTARFGSVTEPGTYTVELMAEQKEYTDDYEILYVRPDTVELTLDRVQSKNFDVEIEIGDITVPDGYVAAPPTSAVQSIIVSGTQEDLDKIACVAARATASGEQKETVEEEVDLLLLDESGKELSKDKFTLSREHTTVTIPVLKMKEVAVTVEYLNVPAGLNTEQIPIHFNVSTLSIAGPADTVEAISSINVGYIDINSIEPGKEYSFDLKLPSGFISTDEVSQIIVTFPLTQLREDTHRVTNVRAVNVPEGYKAEVASNVLYNVSIVGKYEDMNSLKDEDLVAEIDLASVDFVQGYNTLRVTIKAAGKTVFAHGNYTAIVRIYKE